MQNPNFHGDKQNTDEGVGFLDTGCFQPIFGVVYFYW